MEDMVVFVNASIAELGSSLNDPIFLVFMVLALFIGLKFGWVRGLVAVMLLAAVRVGFVDWREFSPEVPPSPMLPFVFAATFFAAGLVAGFAKLLCIYTRHHDHPGRRSY